jgi:hypothetical protein
LQSLPPGIYLLRMEYGQAAENKKLIIQWVNWIK